MAERTLGDVIWLEAKDPQGDLACDFEIANEKARSGLGESLRAGMIGAPRPLPEGVEVTFRGDAWDAVRRYVELESQCCSFLTLRAERDGEVVRLAVTGRPEAREVIAAIFPAMTGEAASE